MCLLLGVKDDKSSNQLGGNCALCATSARYVKDTVNIMSIRTQQIVDQDFASDREQSALSVQVFSK